MMRGELLLFFVLSLVALSAATLPTEVTPTSGPTYVESGQQAQYSEQQLQQISVSCEESLFTLSMRNTNWLVIAGIAIAIAYSVVSFAYMLSRLFGTPELQAWSKNELYQVSATLIMVLLIFVVQNIENGFLTGFGFAPAWVQNPAIDSAKTYLNHVSLFVGGSLLNTYGMYSAIQTAFLSLGIRFKEEPVTILPGIKMQGSWVVKKLGSALQSSFNLVISSLTAALGMTMAQAWLLCISGSVAFTILLPFGIVLRTIPFLRGVGSSFIAIAIGLYLVYPLTFALDEKIVTNIKGENWFTSGYSGVVGGAWQGYTVLRTVFKGKWAPFTFFIMLSSIIGGIYVLLSGFVETAAFAAVVFGAALPFINIVITFGIIREIAKLLGTDVNLNSLLKVI